MAANSAIEWTDASWNCLAGCEAISPGCANCYAATMTRRLEAMGQKDYAGLTTAKHFNGTVRCLPDKLDIPLRWRKPRRVFVNSMSDLFHEDVPDEFVVEVFATMYEAQWHTYQVLTKRAERMASLVSNPRFPWAIGVRAHARLTGEKAAVLTQQDVIQDVMDCWPLPNVWLGVSAEDQQRADERIPWLFKTPAAVRFLSCEPLLGRLDIGLRNWAHIGRDDCRLDWVIVGGESGAGARPCNVADIRFIVEDCKEAGVACFVKQLGSNPVFPGDPMKTAHASNRNKGGDPADWPRDLRVREFPVDPGRAAEAV